MGAVPMNRGLEGTWQIVIAEGSALPQDPEGPSGRGAVEQAAEELRAFLASSGAEARIVAEDEASPGPRVVLRVTGDDERDAFRVRRTDDAIVVEGANPRSVLFGVYRLIDHLRENGADAEVDIEETAHFVERWMPATLHGRTDDESAMRCLARLGVNTTYLRGRRDAFTEVKHFTHYVRDTKHLPEISEACPPKADLVTMAEGAYRLARRFGMEVVMFQDEPAAIVAPASASPEKNDGLPPRLFDTFPRTMVGVAYCPRYRADGWKALSVFHPKVEAHYRELITQVLARFPELRTLYLYNEDAGASNVWPPSDPGGARVYPTGYDGYPWAAHLHLAGLLQETGRAINPRFRVATVTYHWYQPAELRHRMVDRLAPGSVLITLGAWDDSVDTTRLPGWTLDLCGQVLRRGDLVLMADDDFNGTSDDLLMEITAGFPMPLRTWRKLNAWAEAGVTGVTQHHTGGSTLGLGGVTDLAWREFSWRPRVTREAAETWILEMLTRQLSSESAALEMLQACRAVDRALDAVESAVGDVPYGARLHHSYHRFTFPPHLQRGLARKGASTVDYCGDGIRPDVWHASLVKQVAGYAEALERARLAATLAPADKSPFHPAAGTAGPMSCREYAEVAANAVEIVLGFQRTFLNFLDAEQAGRRELTAVWTREKENVVALLDALTARRRWMLSPYGRRILDGLIGRVDRKRRLLEKHGA